MLYIAIGILGATVMPHNLYLHSSIVQTRRIGERRRREAGGDPLRHPRLDHGAGARLLHQRGDPDPRRRPRSTAPGTRIVADISDAYKLLTPLLGTSLASDALRGGAARVGAELHHHRHARRPDRDGGFLDFRLPPWLRRLITRLIAIIPAVIVTAIYGERGIGVAADPEPGDPLAAAVLRRGPAGAVHLVEAEDGPVRESSRYGGSGLARDGRHCRVQRLVAVGDGAAVGRLTAAGVLVLLLTGVIGLRAQQPDLGPIESDRPDLTDGTRAVRPRIVQVEGGYSYRRLAGEFAGHVQSLPELLVRVGILPGAELRIGESYLEQASGSGGAAVRGLDDLYLGTKITLAGQRALRPGVGIELQATLPTGSDGVSAGRMLPGAAALAGWDGPGGWSAGVEFLASGNADHHAEVTTSGSVQYRVSRRATAFVEVVATRTSGEDPPPPESSLSSGVLITVSSHLQVDFHAGAGLARSADRYVVGAGFAVRQ